jgi:hypothetical protein
MNNAKALHLVQELLLKTEHGKIRWQPVTGEQVYVSAFGGKFGLAISYILPDEGPAFVLKVDDGKGEVIRIEQDERGALAGDSKKLYEVVTAQALAIEDASLDSVLAELQRL